MLSPVPRRRRIKATSSPSVPAPQASGSYYSATDAKEFFSWNPGEGSPDSDLLPDLPTLRARIRDLERNNGIAAGGHQTLVDNVIGTGPSLNSTPDYRALNKSADWAEEWASGVESLWRGFWGTEECDAAEKSTGPALTIQIFRGTLYNGEALSLPLWLYRARSKWRTRFQLIEADRLSTPRHYTDGQVMPSGATMRGGIEVGEYGQPIAYWIRNTHPGDDLLGYGYGSRAESWTRIEATLPWGRKRVLHVHDQERAGQSRGRPLLSAVVSQFRMLDAYQRTELQAAIINAMSAAFVETPMDPQSVAEVFGSDFTTGTQVRDYLDNRRELIAPLKGAAIIQLPPGTKMSPFTPTRPSDKFAPFVEAVIRNVGVSLGLPYELLLKDFSKSNYSSARAALLEAWRFFNGRRRWIEDAWLRPVYRLWLEDAVSSGLVEAPAFYDNRAAYESAAWIWPGRGWIDPTKEAEAAQLRMSAGISTLQMECAEQGSDWRNVLEQRARELRLIRELEEEYDVVFPATNATVKGEQEPGESEDTEDAAEKEKVAT